MIEHKGAIYVGNFPFLLHIYIKIYQFNKIYGKGVGLQT